MCSLGRNIEGGKKDKYHKTREKKVKLVCRSGNGKRVDLKGRVV